MSTTRVTGCLKSDERINEFLLCRAIFPRPFTGVENFPFLYSYFRKKVFSFSFRVVVIFFSCVVVVIVPFIFHSEHMLHIRVVQK